MNYEKVKIILIRDSGVKIPRNIPLYAKEIGKFVERYKYAEIKKEMPLLKINYILNNSDKILCSELKRASDLLELLGQTADDKDAVFNEVEMPYPSWKLVKLYPDIWMFFFRTIWFLGYSSHSESFKKAKIRAEEATQKLVKNSSTNHTVALLGHGTMNRFIGKELVKLGWKKKGILGITNWGYVTFEK